MEITLKKADGKYKTLDQLYDEVKESLIDELDCLSDNAALYLGNEIREKNGDERLYENNEENINEKLEDWEPWDLIQLDYDDYADFFYMDYGEPSFTNDVWYGLDTEEIAEAILDGKWYNELPWDLKCMINEYTSAKARLLNINKYRREGENLLAKFMNCDANVGDLLQYIDRITKNDEAWRED